MGVTSVFWVKEGQTRAAIAGEGDLPARRDEGEPEPRRGDDEAGGVRFVPDGEVEGDLAAEAVAIEEEWLRTGRRRGTRSPRRSSMSRAIIADIAAARPRSGHGRGGPR